MKGLKCKVCLAMWLLGMLTVEQVFNDSNHLPNFFTYKPKNLCILPTHRSNFIDKYANIWSFHTEFA